MPPEDFTAEEWAGFLSRELGRPVHVRFGKARQDVLVARPLDGRLDVRMSAHFGNAPASVREATARWLSAGRRARRACDVLDGWIETTFDGLSPTRRPRIRTSGAHHDLAPLKDELLAEEFERRGPPLERCPPVTWGRRSSRRVRRSLQLGSYDSEQEVVRIHPVLDQGGVPVYMVRYVLFHELLHAAMPEERGPSGRLRHHGPRFRARERAFADTARAIAWQDRHLKQLIRSARSGKPLSVRRGLRELLRQGWLFPSAAEDDAR